MQAETHERISRLVGRHLDGSKKRPAAVRFMENDDPFLNDPLQALAEELMDLRFRVEALVEMLIDYKVFRTVQDLPDEALIDLPPEVIRFGAQQN